MNTTTTTTPRTDALEAFYEGNGARWNQAQATLARTLERELADVEMRARSAVTMYGHKAVECAALIAALEAVALTSSPIRGDIYSTDTDALLAVSEIARAALTGEGTRHE